MEELKKDAKEIEKTYDYASNESFAKFVLERGGKISPLVISADITHGTGLMNPSILLHEGKLIGNIRHVNYTFYHSEKKLFQHQWGPLTYLHPENDMHLRTTNHYVEIDKETLEITRHDKVDTSKFDTYEPLWDFVGLEDARLVSWDDNLFLTGVRRDTTTNGQGRMELSQIIVEKDSVKEVKRIRIEPPQDKNSYCEKNWMPIINKPYSYIKWTNPTEIVNVNKDTGESFTQSILLPIHTPNAIRGGSQVISFDEKTNIALTHEVDLFKSPVGRKDAVYRHRFVLWDSETEEIIHYSKDFSLMNGHVEFAVGMQIDEDDQVYITFGFQDNAAYIIKTDFSILKDFVWQK